MAFGRFATCDFDVALRVIDAILALAHEEPTPEVASADALRGVIEMCLGDSERGRRHLRAGTEQARALHPVRYAAVLHYSGTVAALGMCESDELVDDTRDALRRAESFGDIFGIIAAQWAYGTVLLRAENTSHHEAIDVLERVRAGIHKHQVATFALATHWCRSGDRGSTQRGAGRGN